SPAPTSSRLSRRRIDHPLGPAPSQDLRDRLLRRLLRAVEPEPEAASALLDLLAQPLPLAPEPRAAAALPLAHVLRPRRQHHDDQPCPAQHAGVPPDRDWPQSATDRASPASTPVFLDTAVPELIANLRPENARVRANARHALACDRCQEGTRRPGEDDLIPI